MQLRVAFCLILASCFLVNQVSWAQSQIESYIVDTQTYSSDCTIHSASVTVVNCPAKKMFQVILSDMLRNTTVNEIQNDIRGKADSTLSGDERDAKDYIRKIQVDNVNVAMVRPSHEQFEPLYKDSLIVVTQNKTADQSGQYSVTRYWKNIYTHWIETEYLFDVQNGPYDDIFVFDDYAVVLKNKRVIYAVYYEQFLGKVVPGYLVKTLYNTLEAGSTIQKIVFFDKSGEGDFIAVGAVKSAKALFLYPFELSIDWQATQGSLTRIDKDKTVLAQDTELSVFRTTDEFLIVGCYTCDSNQGWIRIYNPSTVRMLFFQRGEQGHQEIGREITVTKNIANSETIWYSTRWKTYLKFNTLTVFRNVDTQAWEFNSRLEMFNFRASSETDFAVFDCFDFSCFFKIKSRSTLRTFDSCGYNSRLISDDSLSGRNCKRCGRITPLSYGFDHKNCYECDSVNNKSTSVSVADKFIYKVACQDDYIDDQQIQINYDDLDPSVSRNDGSGEGRITDGSNDGESESSIDLTTWVIVGASVFGVALIAYIAFKCYESYKRRQRLTKANADPEFEKIFGPQSSSISSVPTKDSRKPVNKPQQGSSLVSRKKVKIGHVEQDQPLKQLTADQIDIEEPQVEQVKNLEKKKVERDETSVQVITAIQNLQTMQKRQNLNNVSQNAIVELSDRSMNQLIDKDDQKVSEKIASPVAAEIDTNFTADRSEIQQRAERTKKRGRSRVKKTTIDEENE